jgi:putative sugar O-methyltransferase
MFLYDRPSKDERGCTLRDVVKQFLAGTLRALGLFTHVDKRDAERTYRLGDDSLDFYEMVAEVEKGSPLYRPSRFWKDLNEINSTMLRKHGLENFKRTVAQNYFNWMVISEDDPQYRSVRKLCPDAESLRNHLRLERPKLLRTTVGLEERAGGPGLEIYKHWPVEAFPRSLLENLGPNDWEIYKLFVGMLWEYSVQQDWAGIGKGAVEPLVGNPIRLFLRGKLISQDLANSVREYNAILCDARQLVSTPKRVAELGAGYGRLAHVFLSDNHTKYYIFDIPPALYVSQWYLSAAHPDKRIFRFRHFDNAADILQELAECDVGFFTPNQIEFFPEGFFDIFASISTLPEMTREQIDNYLRQAERVTGVYVYLKQWLEWENPLDRHLVTANTIRLSENWTPVFDRPDAIQTAFFERLWRRKAD